MDIVVMDRESAAMMYKAAGNKVFVQHALKGKLDNHPDHMIVRRLAGYRGEFEATAREGECLNRQTALNAAANYLDDVATKGFQEESSFGTSLRNGKLYDDDFAGRAFAYHWKRLVARYDRGDFAPSKENFSALHGGDGEDTDKREGREGQEDGSASPDAAEGPAAAQEGEAGS